MSERYSELIAILEEAQGLLMLPENEFVWSGWDSADEAVTEIEEILCDLRRDKLPDKSKMIMLFWPTGPLQEVSLAGGWSDHYLELAKRFDQQIEKYKS